MQNPIQQQLLSFFNNLFTNQSLRKNVYIFNSLNQHMQIHIKTIMKQRKVVTITSNIQIITKALNRCKLVKQKNQEIYIILMKGDQTIVKITKNSGENHDNKINKKDILTYAKHMKYQFIINDDYNRQQQNLELCFMSHAAAIQFIERVKANNQGYICQLKQKNPYKCLQESISLYRKDKHNKNSQANNQPYNQVYNNQIYMNQIQYNQLNQINPLSMPMYQQYDNQYMPYYPIFIRKAVNSEDQQDNNQKNKKITNKKYIQKQQKQKQSQNVEQRVRLNSEDFPSFQTLNSNINKLGLNDKDKYQGQKQEQEQKN